MESKFVIDLRPATIADLDLLRHWDEQAHVLAADPNDDWGWDVELDRSPIWREQLIAQIDDRSDLSKLSIQLWRIVTIGVM